MSEWVRASCDTSACVEVAAIGRDTVVLRSAFAPLGARRVEVTRDEWDAFVTAVKAGDFDTV